MPKGFSDNEYIPRKDWAGAAINWFAEDLAAKRRLEQLMGRLEPLRKEWTPQDEAYLLALGIKPF